MSEPGSDDHTNTPDKPDGLPDVIAAEREYIAERRDALDLPAGTIPDDVVGLALSGGGIRSATFNLGFLQGLAKRHVLRHVDYLSTVSGGGYIGSCLTSLLHPRAARHRRKEPQKNSQCDDQPSVNADASPFRFKDEQSGNERPELKHLRSYGAYLMPSGRLFSLDCWCLIGMYLTGLITNNLFPIAIILALASLSMYHGTELTYENFKYGYWIAGGLFAVAVVVRSVATWFNLSHRSRKVRGKLVGGLVLASAFAATSTAAIHMVDQDYLSKALSKALSTFGAEGAQQEPEPAFDFVNWLGAVSVASLLGLGAGLFKSKGKRLQPVLEKTFKAARFTVIPVLLLWLLWTLNNLSGESWMFSWGPVLSAAAIVLVASFLVNPNRTSMHHFYRDRLSEAYIVKVDDDGTIGSNEELDLVDLYPEGSKSGAPYHLINATLNVPTASDPDLRGRRVAPFLYSAFYCGSESTGYRKTKQFTEYGDTRLATAMAVSGAAVNPQAADRSSPGQTFLMTLLNLRLNRWVPNPRHSYKLFGVNYPFRAWPLYFFYELLRRGSEKGRLLNLSDGGQFDNLGIYALLQRRCQLIIVSDASMDENFEFQDLADLVRRARVDMGIDLHFRRDGLTPVDDSTPMYHMTAEIEYPGETRGLLIYVKTCTRGTEPLDLTEYKRNVKKFPDESTNDQFFDEPQFESYRKLGELAAKEICESGGDIDKVPVEAFFKNLHAEYSAYCSTGKRVSGGREGLRPATPVPLQPVAL